MRSLFAAMARVVATVLSSSSLRRRRRQRRSSSPAPCDCSDMCAVVPDAPSLEYLRGVVAARLDATAAATTTNGDDVDNASAAAREEAARRATFELRYCCGAAGRCACAGAPPCRYPRCVALRPRGKGDAVYAARRAYEADVDAAPTPEVAALVRQARGERLDDVIAGIRALVRRELAEAACGRPLAACLRDADDSGDSSSSWRDDDGAVNPLRGDAVLCERVVALYLWRAALLVNARRDDAATHSLLNLADALAPSSPLRTRVCRAAASWAALHDAEVIYYRATLQRHDAWPHATSMATTRAMLLPRVVAATCGDAARLRDCAHVVLVTELGALMARMRDGNGGGDVVDDSEDVLRSLCVPLALVYYRFGLGDAFWHAFCELLCSPTPAHAAMDDDDDDARGGGKGGDDDTARGARAAVVADAVARGMLLHHLLRYTAAREDEIARGVVAARVAALRRDGRTPRPCDYAQVLDERGVAAATSRLRRLLLLARRANKGDGGAAARAGVTASRDAGAAPLPRT